MSEPVPDTEIEDVLSSIRRLVSVEDREPRDASPREDDKADKLVLTPALRVDETAGGSRGAGSDSAEASVQAPFPGDDHAAEAGDDKFDAAVPDAPDEDRPEPVGETAAAGWDDSHTVSEDDQNPDEAAEAESGPAPVEDTAEDDPDAGEDADIVSAPQDALSARAAGFEEAVAAREDVWEPDGDSGDDYAAQPMDTLPWEDFQPDETGQPASTGTVDKNEGLEPFHPEDDLDHYEEPALQSGPDNGDNAFLAEEDPLGPNEAIMDEEALRDLVAEIVRQELQGTLGERITRNVRKLVRREIHRALAAQELE